MERYEAILEQLKKAQSRGMETFSNRFDFMVKSLEELVQEVKNSVQEGQPQSAEECFPTEDVVNSLRSFHEEAKKERLRADELAARIEELESAQSEETHGESIELLRSLDRSRSQSELLKELLPAISQYAARSVVLVLREGRASAWSGIGFADAERLRGWQGEAAESAALAKLLESNRPIRFAPADDEFFSVWLADEEPAIEILLIPVVLRGKLMGAVYVDHIEKHPWEPEKAQSLVAQVCWLIDTLGFRPEPAPALAEPVTVEAVVEAVPEEDPGKQAAIPEPEPEPEPELEPEPEPEPVAEPEPERADAIEEPVEPEEDPSATMRIDLPETPNVGDDAASDLAADETAEPAVPTEHFEPEEPTEPEVEIATDSFSPPEDETPDFAPPIADAEAQSEPEEEPAAEVASTETEPVSAEVQPVTPPVVVEPEEDDDQAASETETVPTEVLPVTPPDEKVEEKAAPESRFPDEPPPVQPVQPPPDEPEDEISEDEAQREEAQRFARLLVSEIKLYNEEQVERGRETKDLYHRLKEDIDRSREMFEKRISSDVRAKQDFFQDELVRILAGGDADVLGM